MGPGEDDDGGEHAQSPLRHPPHFVAATWGEGQV